MAISYNKLWKLLIDRGMKKTELIKLSGITSNAMAKMGRNESVQVDTLGKVCAAHLRHSVGSDARQLNKLGLFKSSINK